MSGKSPTRQMMPDFQICRGFDGKSSAARWLNKLAWEFEKAAGGPGVTYHNEALKAIDMLCEGEAAIFLDSSSELRSILDKSQTTTATPKEYRLVQDALKQRFPALMTDDRLTSPSEELRDLRQAENETLQAYFTRTNSILARLGVRDLPKDSIVVQTTPISLMEKCVLSNVIERFVMGLSKRELRQEAIDKGALDAIGLWQAFDKVRLASRVFEQKAAFRAAEAKRARITLLEQFITQQTGLDVNSALHQHFPGYGTYSPLSPGSQPLNTRNASPPAMSEPLSSFSPGQPSYGQPAGPNRPFAPPATGVLRPSRALGPSRPLPDV